MNLVLLLPEDFVSSDRVRLSDHRAEHIREIHRAQVGKILKVGLLNGGLGEGRVTDLSKKYVEMTVEISALTKEAPPPGNVSLIVALPRPQTLKKILESTATLGIRRLFLVSAEQVQKSYFGSKLLKENVWLKHQRLGLEQGGRTHLPPLSLHPSLKTFLEKDLSKEVPPVAIRWICHPESTKRILDFAPEIRKAPEVLCAIGPEGGWRSEEISLFQKNGFEALSLGPTIHRVENAVVAFLAQWELLVS